MGKQGKIVKFEGGNTLVWRHPINVIDENTVVICPHTHEVVFFKQGAMLETLKAGSHVLFQKQNRRENTNKEAKKAGAKFLVKKQNLLSKKLKQMECHFLFVNVSSTLKILWGTPSRIELFDSKINIPVSVGLNGSFLIQIENGRKFITKLGGLDATYTLETLQEFFRGIMLLYIKDSLANAMIVEKISFYEIWSNMRKISSAIKKDLEEKFLEYGVELSEFAIENIVIPEETKQLVENLYKEKFEIESKGLSFQQMYEDKKEKELAEMEMQKEILIGGSKKVGQFCSDCGQKIEDGDVFCTKCGKKVIEEEKTCGKCGFVVAPRANFCPNCGENVGGLSNAV